VIIGPRGDNERGDHAGDGAERAEVREANRELAGEKKAAQWHCGKEEGADDQAETGARRSREEQDAQRGPGHGAQEVAPNDRPVDVGAAPPDARDVAE
jgi:hypothetical protein